MKNSSGPKDRMSGERKFLIGGEYPGSSSRRRDLGEEDGFELPHLPR